MAQSSPSDRPHSDLTRSIIESAMRAQRVLGVGLYEKPYKLCLAHALRQKGHQVLVEVHLDIQFEGLLVPDSYRIDLLVDDAVVVEAKTVDRLTPIHQAQVCERLRTAKWFSPFDRPTTYNDRMISKSNDFWFPAKSYGWGWGPPVAWQGWVVMIAYMLVVTLSAIMLEGLPRMMALVGLTIALIGICWLKGEQPRWRWGKDR